MRIVLFESNDPILKQLEISDSFFSHTRANVILKNNVSLKLADFGLSCSLLNPQN